SQGITQIPRADLADSPPDHQPFAPDHPELPFPFDSTAVSFSNPDPANPSSHPTNPRRRRLSSTSSEESLVTRTAGTGIYAEDAGPREAASQTHPSSQPGRLDGRSPSRKRRRLATMRADTPSTTNGYSQASNGSTLRKNNLNGQLTAPANGETHSNGTGKSLLANSSYYGHNREEVTRILIQSLYELGYNDAASTLSAESGYELETSGVATFRNAVLGGRWSEAEKILIQSFRNSGSNNGQKSAPEETLVLAEEADRSEMLFYLRQQKFLELLEARDLASALLVLRQELTPLNYDVDRLHALSSPPLSPHSLLMCPMELLHDQAGWDGPVSLSRERLLADLSKSISPSVMIPQHRLAILLNQVKRNQIHDCLYHNTAYPPSLYSDHMCDRNDFPLEVTGDLTHHADEVWHCGFSHDGTKLVTAGQDRSVLIYDTNDFSVLHKLTGHSLGVAFASWSPDDSKLITCSQDHTARVWNVETGRCLLTIDHHSYPVTSAGWAPDGESFITSSFDANTGLCLWSMRGTSLHTWKGGFRVYDCAVSPDGRRLVAADTDSKLHVFDFQTREEDYCLSLPSKPTSVAISKDSKFVLVNLAEGEIQLIDLDTTTVARRFRGHKQGGYVIRSIFGGAGENFVVSGSEDSRIYIWHKENGTLVETLEGHMKGCVNSISWNPEIPTMFASAGDDKAVRIWTPGQDRSRSAVEQNQRRGVSPNGYPRTSALRTTSAF
ncbi:hypothetical protein N7462_010933, partial [Penicillium macrosclerotiorum]|uniref:uncharacterized protein n=1 Tax=Penicillium macrosclerotiorum TaxID=303699 RepID=UPI002546E755